MKMARRLAFSLALIAAAAAAMAQAKALPQVQSVSVSSAAALVKAIGPDRTIVLKKGDYKLRTAYGIESGYASWSEGEEGGELSISDVQNLTIRGAEGVRIISDEGMSSILGIYGSKNVTLDNLSFKRLPQPDSDVGAGSLYAESVEGLVIDRCSFVGSTTIAIELWECADVAIRRSSISGASSGALSASSTSSLTMSGSSVTDCEGYPLFYFEDSNRILLESSELEGNTGGNLVEIYAEPDSEPEVAFNDCAFSGNEVEYFAGSSILPVTEGCRFEGNSFGEDWETASVAPASDMDYNEGDYEDDYEEEGPQWYDHPSGLSFSYPSYWEMREYEGKKRVGFFSPDDKSLVIFLPAYKISANIDPAKEAKKLFADAYASFAKLLKSESGVVLDLKAEGESYTDNGLLSADYSGSATKDEGEKAQARARLIVSKGEVFVMIGLAEEAWAFESGGEIDAILASVVVSDQEGE
jgi:hypothetical protein